MGSVSTGGQGGSSCLQDLVVSGTADEQAARQSQECIRLLFAFKAITLCRNGIWSSFPKVIKVAGNVPAIHSFSLTPGLHTVQTLDIFP